MEKQAVEKKNKTVEKEKKIPNEVPQEIVKKIFGNLLKSIGLMVYFIVLNIAYSSMKQERLIEDIKVFAGAYLLIGLVMLEKAYKEEKTESAITGIEFMFISLHSLSIMHVITMFKYDFRYYLLTSSYIFSIYYVLKSIILYTKERKDYLKSLSDISEIVKKEEPVKKEAKKRNNLKEKESIKQETKLKSKNNIKKNTNHNIEEENQSEFLVENESKNKSKKRKKTTDAKEQAKTKTKTKIEIEVKQKEGDKTENKAEKKEKKAKTVDKETGKKKKTKKG